MHICVGKTFPCADGHSGKRLVDQKKKERETWGGTRHVDGSGVYGSDFLQG